MKPGRSRWTLSVFAVESDSFLQPVFGRRPRPYRGRKVPTLPTLPTLPMGYVEMIKVAIMAERSRDGSTFKAIKTVCRAPQQVCLPFRGARDLEHEADAANYKVQ